MVIMKELTIEEKARAYDEALIRGSRLWECGEITKENYEYIFPSLKESEDERIRKALRERIIRYDPNNEILIKECGISQKQFLAWLEKQGDKDKLIKELGEYKFKYTQEVLEKHINSMSNKDDERLRKTTIAFLKDFAEQGYENAVECIDWLEKQGEQKPADKVEPKFKVGAWIALYKKPCQIISINDNGNYIVQYCDDKKTHELSKNFCESHFHLWTVQDAKDGDVLAAEDKDKIFIYNGKLDLRGRVCGYCGIYKTHAGSRFTGCAIGNYFTYKEPYPATKEQCDFLFQKMHEAGYEWDSEKKELKKIEQSTIEEVNGEDYGIDSLYHAQRILEKTLGSVDGYQSDDGILEHKCAISAVKKLYEQKSAVWSEEDERMFNSALWHVKNSCGNGGKNSGEFEVYNWFKSLKNRVQPKQEWSKEDETNASYICAALDCYLRLREERNNINCQEDLDKARNWLYNKLKSLRPRSTWKPSDEQMLAINTAINVIGKGTINGKYLVELHEQLLKLREK